MADAEVTVTVEDRADYTLSGKDTVSILLKPHQGAEPRALGRGASGGELSRVMLAIEVVIAGSDPVPTFIFDEVDAGVGGAAAIEIGRRLAKLAEVSQVIVVTHLPQVAAFAANHLRVLKDSDGGVTASSVLQLDDEQRVTELARMLSGLSDSESGLAHARDLIETARGPLGAGLEHQVVLGVLREVVHEVHVDRAWPHPCPPADRTGAWRPRCRPSTAGSATARTSGSSPTAGWPPA